jgi:eukaryotic translation initiation factor 2C
MQALFRKAVATWTFLKDDQDSFATDGQKTIVSWKNLHDNVDISKSWGIDVGRNTSLKARFSFVGKVGINDLLQQSRCDFEQEKIDLASVERCLNIIIAKSFDENVVRLSGKKFYVRKARTDLDSSKSLELMRGYHYTVKPGMGNLLMNFNVATSAFFCPVLVSEFLAETATFGNATERTSLLRQLRVYIEYPHKEERLNRPGARIKKICAVGPSLIKDLNFRKKVKDNERRPILDATGNWQLETNATTVVDHLEAGKYNHSSMAKQLTNSISISYAGASAEGSESHQCGICYRSCILCCRDAPHSTLPIV